MMDHTDEGAMGVVLNRPTSVEISDLWQKLDSDVEVYIDGKVHVGGPVEGPIIALHDQFSMSDEMIIDEVYMTMTSDRMNQLVAKSGIKFRVFSGYSGWAPGQLEAEVQNGGWLVTEATSSDVYGSPEALWKSVCERVGNKIMFPGLPDISSGTDPNLN